MKESLIVVFGRAGVGKDTASGVFARSGYMEFLADNETNPDFAKSLHSGQMPTTVQRNEVMTHILSRTAHLAELYPQVVVNWTFPTEPLRKRFLNTFPDAEFCYIDTDTGIIRTRLDSVRSHSLLTAEQRLQTHNVYEAPDRGSYRTVVNNGTMVDLRKELVK